MPLNRCKEISEINPNPYIGKPWKLGGSGPDSFDCFGLLMYVYKHELGIDLPFQFDMTGYDLMKGTDAIEAGMTHSRWVHINKPEHGCAVALSKNKRIHHVGIWIRDGCLHAVDGQGVVFYRLIHLKRNGYKRMEYYKWQT